MNNDLRTIDEMKEGGSPVTDEERAGVIEALREIQGVTKKSTITVDEAKEYLKSLDAAEDEIKARKALYELFWKEEADFYLNLTTRIGANGASYSRRLKSSARPGWLTNKQRRGRGQWMVGDGQNQMGIQFLGQMFKTNKKGHTKKRQIRKTGRGT